VSPEGQRDRADLVSLVVALIVAGEPRDRIVQEAQEILDTINVLSGAIDDE
jgi:hypothetical protein